MTNPLADLSNILSSLTPEDLQRLLQRLAGESEPTAQRIRYLLQPRAAVRHRPTDRGVSPEAVPP